jgi:hypothetical protein
MIKLPPRPTPASLRDEALLRLLQGERITHRDFDATNETYRLAAVSFALRWRGWLIASSPEVGKSRSARTLKFSRYYIPRPPLREYQSRPEVQRWLGKEVQQ